MDLALFDFDGTITWTDTWTPFMQLAVRPARIAAGRVLLSPIVIGYKLGMISASRGRQLAARVGFQGEDAARMRRLGVEYASTTLPAQVRQPALDRIAWHRSRGDHVVIVSASLDVYLCPWCAGHGLDCICTTLEERSGWLTGRYAGGDCAGAEKVRRIRARLDLGRYETIYAYGDTAEDREMLELAQRKFYRWTEISSWDQVTGYAHPPSHAGRD
jgi:HAD superfamily hydrolase (TIGR01490 family)